MGDIKQNNNEKKKKRRERKGIFSKKVNFHSLRNRNVSLCEKSACLNLITMATSSLIITNLASQTVSRNISKKVTMFFGDFSNVKKVLKIEQSRSLLDRVKLRYASLYVNSDGCIFRIFSHKLLRHESFVTY